MQNGYVKALAQKTFQEAPVREPYRIKKKSFHPPSFVVGLVVSLILVGLV